MLQSTLFIPTLDTTTEFVIITISLSQNRHLRGNSHKTCKNIVSNTLKKHMFWICVRIDSGGDSNKYQKHMFCEEIRTNNTFLTYHSVHWGFFAKQIHYNGNTFGNKFCRCNEGSLYVSILKLKMLKKVEVSSFLIRLASFSHHQWPLYKLKKNPRMGSVITKDYKIITTLYIVKYGVTFYGTRTL